jgi:hypothetical protein
VGAALSGAAEKTERSAMTDKEIVDYIDKHGVAGLTALLTEVYRMCALGQYPRPDIRGAFQLAKQLRGVFPHA